MVVDQVAFELALHAEAEGRVHRSADLQAGAEELLRVCDHDVVHPCHDRGGRHG